ncbi:MAG: hypothetical protein AABZ44_02580, partial [Elusimicrobiota bacterium]
MKKVIFALHIVALLSAHAVASQPFVPATRIKVDVKLNVSLSISSFTFSYAVESSRASEQSVYQFFVETRGALVEALSPSKWTFGNDGFVVIWTAEVGGDIVPGGQLDGFKIRTKALPGLVKVYVRGLAPLPSVEMGENPEILGPIPDEFEDAIILPSIGPDTFVATATITDLISRLISIKHQAYSLGWISGPGAEGIVNSLDAKLDAAL